MVLQFRRGQSPNPAFVLQPGEPAYDLANHVLKIGDSAGTPWGQLPALGAGGTVDPSDIEAAVEAYFDAHPQPEYVTPADLADALAAIPDYVTPAELIAALNALPDYVTPAELTAAIDALPDYVTSAELAAAINALPTYVTSAELNAAIAAIPAGISISDSTASTSSVWSSSKTQTEIATKVTGPSSSTSGNLPAFNATTGKSVADSGIASSDLARLSTTQTFTGTKTFQSAPTVPDSSFSISKTTGLQSALDGKTTESYVNSQVTPLRTIPISTVTTSATLALDNSRGMVNVNSATSVTITVPDNATVAFPTGTQVIVRQVGIGQVTIGGSGVTLQTSASLKTRTQYSVVMLVKVDTNVWSVSGDVE